MVSGNDLPSIFIQIPSYRDFELNKTVASAVNNASGLNKLSFGIHNCILFDCEIEVKTDYPEWVAVHSTTSIAPKNIGLQQARYIANEFYAGEDYYLQIDSHFLKIGTEPLSTEYSVIKEWAFLNRLSPSIHPLTHTKMMEGRITNTTNPSTSVEYGLGKTRSSSKTPLSRHSKPGLFLIIVDL